MDSHWLLTLRVKTQHETLCVKGAERPCGHSTQSVERVLFFSKGRYINPASDK